MRTARRSRLASCVGRARARARRLRHPRGAPRAEAARRGHPAPAPANDALANAQVVHSLPASLNGTTVGADHRSGRARIRMRVRRRPTPSGTACAPRAPQRVALDLAAGGALDATVDVYHAVRSQLSSVGCQQTEAHGKASLSFNASKNGLYVIRVAALRELAARRLHARSVPAHARRRPARAARCPPAAPAARSTASRTSTPPTPSRMHSGVSYLINLANETEGACVSGALFAPGTSSFEEEESLACCTSTAAATACSRPAPARAGATASSSPRATPPRHPALPPAGRPRRPRGNRARAALGNYAHAHGRLDGSSVHVLRLYRMEVTSHSNLTLKLTRPTPPNSSCSCATRTAT